MTSLDVSGHTQTYIREREGVGGGAGGLAGSALSDLVALACRKHQAGAGRGGGLCAGLTPSAELRALSKGWGQTSGR